MPLQLSATVNNIAFCILGVFEIRCLKGHHRSGVRDRCTEFTLSHLDGKRRCAILVGVIGQRTVNFIRRCPVNGIGDEVCGLTGPVDGILTKRFRAFRASICHRIIGVLGINLIVCLLETLTLLSGVIPIELRVLHVLLRFLDLSPAFIDCRLLVVDIRFHCGKFRATYATYFCFVVALLRGIEFTLHAVKLVIAGCAGDIGIISLTGIGLGLTIRSIVGSPIAGLDGLLNVINSSIPSAGTFHIGFTLRCDLVQISIFCFSFLNAVRESGMVRSACVQCRAFSRELPLERKVELAA